MTEKDEIEFKLKAAKSLLYEHLCESYNKISAHMRAYRDICRKFGMEDRSIQENIDQINIDAIEFIEHITELVESGRDEDG